MKLIIAGGRDFVPTQLDYDKVWVLFLENNVTEIVSGGARGADAFGEKLAKSNKKRPLKVFPANWDRYGKSAGYIRNVQMADYADAVLLFPGGKGTDHMYNIAVEHGLKIFDWREKNG